MSTTTISHTEPPKKRSAVQPDEIFAHLRILGVFHKLKLDVQARSPHNPTGLWTAFLGYAVEKFASWITNVVDKEDGNSSEELREEEFPTLDVAMVWHAYILLITAANQNPLEYYKDCQKSHSGLMRIKAFPVKRLAEVIDTLGLEPRFPVPAFGTRGVRIGPQFSLDLVAAVKRQASFVAQVVAVGWTQKPKGIHEITGGCIDKYHGFLKKIWENSEYLAVPTLEIDLAWHTHQLNIDQYRQDSIMLFGRILQHDDDVPSPELNKAFRRNSYNWQNLFHMDYSAGAISSGFRPVSLSAPGTPESLKRSSIINAPKTNSEISLQEFYKDVSEKRLSIGADTSSRTSSSSFSTPSSSRESTSSPDPSFHTATSTSRPSSAGHDSVPPRTNVTPQILPPGNDSTVTISRYPSTSVLSASTLTSPDSRGSSTSELGSIFAYTPPKGWSDSRGAFDRPPSSLKLSPPVSNAIRPSSAGNNLPNNSSLRRQRYRLSASAGTLYVPEMSSPLSQPPEMNPDVAEYDRPQLSRTPSAYSGKSSGGRSHGANTRSNLSRSSSALTTSSVPSSSYTSRPSSSGNSGNRAPASYAVPQRPSTSGGVDVSARETSIRGPLKLFRRASFLRLPVDDSKTTGVFENGTMKYPTPSRAATLPGKRPSTAPQPAAMASPIIDGNEWPRSGGLFRKKSRSEKPPVTKRPWFRFW